MDVEVYAVKSIGSGRIFVMPCPKSQNLECELYSLKDLGIDHIVSLLEDTEATRLGMEQEARICDQLGLDFTSFAIPDHKTPKQPEAFRELVNRFYQRLQKGENIAIHCFAGIGRTGLLAGSLLIRDGMTAAAAMDLLSDIRGYPVPQTHKQSLYLLDFETGAEKTITIPERPRNWFTRWLSPA